METKTRNRKTQKNTEDKKERVMHFLRVLAFKIEKMRSVVLRAEDVGDVEIVKRVAQAFEAANYDIYYINGYVVYLPQTVIPHGDVGRQLVAALKRCLSDNCWASDAIINAINALAKMPDEAKNVARELIDVIFDWAVIEDVAKHL